jgi:hypothetical protein
VIAHVDGAGNIDPSSGLQIDPLAVEEIVHREVWDGVRRRWFAIEQGVCACGGELMMTNRQQRRNWRRLGLEAYDALVFHERECTATSERTRTWIYKNRGLAQ